MRKIAISISLLFFAAVSQAQQLGQRLFEKGFENVMLLESEDSLKVFFEHREFRNTLHSVRYAELLLEEEVNKPIGFIPMHHNQPMGLYIIGSSEVRNLTTEEKQYFTAQNSLYKGYRFSFRIHPDFSARFGYYDHPLQTKLNLIVDTRIYLAKGLSLQTGISIPVVNKLDNQDMQLKMAPSMLHYFAQPYDNHFLAISIGSFYYDRYGFDLQYRYAPFNGDWSFGFESGYTGFYWLNAGAFIADPLDDLVLVGDVEYKLPIEGLHIKLTGGQFLFADKGIRGDLIKKFDSAEFGLYASATEAGNTVGFNFAFALWPGTIFRSKKFELRTTDEFRWEYSYNNEAAVGRRYRIGVPRLGDELRMW